MGRVWEVKSVDLWVVEVARKLRAFIVVAEAVSMAAKEDEHCVSG